VEVPSGTANRCPGGSPARFSKTASRIVVPLGGTVDLYSFE